jgi:hypothetical protein
MYSASLSLTLALEVSAWSTPRPGRFTPGKVTRYPMYRRLDVPMGRSGWVGKISLPLGFDSQTAIIRTVNMPGILYQTD